MSMLVESVNMQLEAEVSDLLDRSSVALYGSTAITKEDRPMINLPSNETEIAE